MQYKVSFIVDAAKVGDLIHPLIKAKIPFDMDEYSGEQKLLTGPRTKDPKGKFAKQVEVLGNMQAQFLLGEYKEALKAAGVKAANPSALMVRLVKHGYVLRKQPGIYDRVLR